MHQGLWNSMPFFQTLNSILMKNTIFLLLFIFSFVAHAQDDNTLFKINLSPELKPYTTGYMNSAGDTIIPIGKYKYCFTQVFKEIAVVGLKEKPGFYAINRDENVLFEVHEYDNGPDIIKDGLFRIILNNKVGYSNTKGEIVIKPHFDAALPLKKGYAPVCIGGYDEKKGDYSVRVGGKWGIIDKTGKVIIDTRYNAIRILNNGKAKVKMNDKWSFISLE